MNKKLIEELREWWDKRPGTGMGYSAILEWGTEFQEILSRHEAEQGGEEGLREGIKMVISHYKKNGIKEIGVDAIENILRLEQNRHPDKSTKEGK